MNQHAVHAYIASSPAPVRPILQKIRQTIRAAAPEAEEIISYRMPAYRLNGILLFFGLFKEHIGIYPPISGPPGLMKELAKYSGPKGNLKFPLDRPMPYALIRKIVKLRVRQDLERAANKKKKK